MTLLTERLELRLLTREQALAAYERMTPEDQRHVDPVWLARVEQSPPDDPWVRGFAMVRRSDGVDVGQCGFAGPPDEDGVVEIAYAVHEAFRRNGYATEAAVGLCEFVAGDARVRLIRAHTLESDNASSRVLRRCGFSKVGETIDHAAGVVWRWERAPGRER